MKIGTDGVLLGAWSDVRACERILDIGAGSGLIATMLAQRAPAATAIHGVEIDPLAARQAEENVRQSPYADRLSIFEQSIQDFADHKSFDYDLIVSNPPFFTGGTLSANHDRNAVRHTVKLAHGDLLRAVQELLSEEGKFSVILPYLEGLRFSERAEHYKLFNTRVTEVRPLADRPVERLLMEFRKRRPAQPPQPEKLVLRTGKPDEYTEAFRTLTRDFYLGF